MFLRPDRLFPARAPQDSPVVVVDPERWQSATVLLTPAQQRAADQERRLRRQRALRRAGRDLTSPQE